MDEKSANFEKATDAITQKFSPKKARNIIVAGMFAGGIIMGGLPILAITKLFKLKGAKKYIISAITGTVGAVIGSLCGMVTTMSMYYTKQIKNQPEGKEYLNFLKNKTPKFDIKIEQVKKGDAEKVEG